MVFSDVSICKR